MLQNLATQQTPAIPDNPISAKSKLSRLVESSFFWGGVGAVMALVAISFSRIMTLFTSWVIVSLAIIKVNFFERKKRLLLICGDIGIVLLLAVSYATLWRSLPKEQPSLDQSIDIAISRLVGRLPVIKQTEIVTVPAAPTPQHSHMGFESLAEHPSDAPIAVPFKGGQKIGINFSYRNVGGSLATVTGFGAKLKVVSVKQMDDECCNLTKAMQPRVRGGNIPQTLGGYYTEYIELTDADALGLNTPEFKALCGAEVLGWKDESGKYETLGCQCLFGIQVGAETKYAWHSTADDNKELKR